MIEKNNLKSVVIPSNALYESNNSNILIELNKTNQNVWLYRYNTDCPASIYMRYVCTRIWDLFSSGVLIKRSNNRTKPAL